MKMRLNVYVLEARDLPAKDLNGLTDAYVKLHVGKCKSRTRVVRKDVNPIWNEEFVFRVEDLNEELTACVFHEDGFFNGQFVGQVRVPVWMVFQEEKHTLPHTWLTLQPKTSKSTKNSDCGKILLSISLYGRSDGNRVICPFPTDLRLSGSDSSNMEEGADLSEESPDFDCSTTLSTKVNDLDEQASVSEEKPSIRSLAGRLVQRVLSKNGESSTTISKNLDSSELSNALSGDADNTDGPSPSSSFVEALENFQARDQEPGMPENLPGGVLLDKTYLIGSKYLNTLLFGPNSQFMRDLAELQGTLDLREGPWVWLSGEHMSLRRAITYIKAATRFVKAVTATEKQTYVKADGKSFVVLVSVSTPEVPYGNCFRIELLYKINPGTELLSNKETSRLVISWNINFCQSTMMRSMIEGAARQGLKESYEQFADLLAQNAKPVDSVDVSSDKEQILASLHMEQQSDWELAVHYFWNFTVVSTILMVLYVLLHILLAKPKSIQGLEFNGLDLPDSFGEVITCGLLVLQGERVFRMISHFMQAKLQRGSDHGVKAKGGGWLLTVALIEGNNVASAATNGISDPYVVFTCNGKTRTSSVKLQTHDPQWTEILEFDAMEEPPSVLDVEVFDFDGPFDQAMSLGHAEINFLKHTSAEMADMWVPLEGKLAQAYQTKLHLRIFLDNTKGTEIIKEYLIKMEKEVGKKINLRSPHRNSTFHKLFGLPMEEFLINDFSCYLKRKMPLQGRIFVSARIFGFYANFFGHKTKFFFLWEDIEDIQVIPPSLATLGCPLLVIILLKGKGVDARHAAKSHDEEGRLRFHFQSFASFNLASRTIMALWRTRTLTPEQKTQIADEEKDHDGRSVQPEDNGSFLGVEDANISEVYIVALPVTVNSLMEIFDGGCLDHKIMGKVGCLNYMTTPWEPVKPDVYERHICYKFNRHVSNFGGEVTSTQQKAFISNGNGWVVDEVMSFHDIPFGDHFRVHLKYQIENDISVPSACQCHVYVRISWFKNKFQRRIAANIFEKLALRIKEIFYLAEKEILNTEKEKRGNVS